MLNKIYTIKLTQLIDKKYKDAKVKCRIINLFFLKKDSREKLK